MLSPLAAHFSSNEQPHRNLRKSKSRSSFSQECETVDVSKIKWEGMNLTTVSRVLTCPLKILKRTKVLAIRVEYRLEVLRISTKV